MSTDHTLAYGTHASAAEGRCAMATSRRVSAQCCGPQPVRRPGPQPEQLRLSAFALLDRMLPTVPLAPAVVKGADRPWARSAVPA